MVVSRAAENNVVAITAEYHVITVSRDNVVISSPAVYNVIAGPSINVVIATCTVYLIGTQAAEKHVVCGSSYENGLLDDRKMGDRIGGKLAVGDLISESHRP